MPAFSTCDRFRDLDPKDRDRLDALSTLEEFADGAIVLTADQPTPRLHLIADGAVEILGPPGREAVIARLRPGDLFGEVEAFAQMPPGVRHAARGKTICRAVEKPPLKQEILSHRSLGAGLLAAYSRSISEKIRQANQLAVTVAPPARVDPGKSAARSSQAGALSPEEAAWLGMLGRSMSAGGGETIVREGDVSRTFYLIQSGSFEVRKATPAGYAALAHLGPGQLFGFMAFADGRPRSASVVAMRDSMLVEIQPDALERATHLNFTVGFKFLGTLCTILGRTFSETVQRAVGDR